MYESGDGDGSLAAGTIVLPISRSFSLHAVSVDEIEQTLRKDVLDGKLPGGRIYEICPGTGNLDEIRLLAICSESKTRKVNLEAAKGLYSEFRRIRYPEQALPNPELKTPPECLKA